jgi:hypothetical protein
VGEDVLEKAAERATLRRRIAASVAHDHTAIAQLHQASEVIDNLRRGPGAQISAAVRPCPGLPKAEKEFMAETEVAYTSPLRFAPLLERA